MLRITVEFFPKGDEARKQEIGRMEIINTLDADDPPEKGNYTVKMAVIRNGNTVGLHQRRIVGFPRTQLNVWGLLFKALIAFTTGPSGEHNMEPFELNGWSDV